LTELLSERLPIPRDRENDYTREAQTRRGEFINERTGVELEHVTGYSFDPSILSGNVEQFVGVAQVPIGLAGPLLVNGEHAQGEFYVPLATAGRTLVASECLEMLGCYGSGNVMKFAEVVAATILCGELSLGSTIVAEEWVEAHDLYGRNRP
jgi:hydroxymethylglutaryl-CoA reductase